MAKSKIETQFMTAEQARVVLDLQLELSNFVEASVCEPAKFTPASVLRHPREWAKLAPILVAKEMPRGFELRFEKMAAYYNERCKSAAIGNQKPPKSLTAGECRKIIISLTRDQLRSATLDLKRNEADDTAKLAKEQALAILEKYGWTQQKTNRKKKAGKPSESMVKAAPEPATSDPNPASGTPTDAVNSHGSSPKQTPLPLTGPGIAKKDGVDVPQSAESSIRFYLKGNSDELSEQFHSIGGERDDVKGEWYFPTSGHQTIARNLRNGLNDKKALGLKAAK